MRAVRRGELQTRLTGLALVGLALAGLALAACGQTAPSPSFTAEGSPSAVATSAPSSAAALPTSSEPVAPPSSTAAPTDTLGPAPALAVQPVASVPAALAIANAHDGTNRLYVASQAGQVRLLDGGRLMATPVLDIAGRITSGGERGLLGLAFHPRFPTDPRLFVDYTDLNGNTVVASFDVRGGGAPGATVSADPASERVILRVTQPYPNHNGGGLAFGPDGDLYIALGDGGSAGDPQGNGQRLDTLLGKLLRIDVDAATGSLPYGIPAGNPFAERAGARPEIWLYGLRNPYRFSFDRATGDLWIGDVGQNLWEEVDVVRGAGGGNFGWNRMEGFHCYAPANGCDQSGLIPPVAEYGHGPGCSIVGGYVYRGPALTALRGRYVFSDYCSGQLMVIDASRDERQEPTKVGVTGAGVAGFGEDEAGELYVANVSSGSVGRLVIAP